jgi:hypothetical protein
MRRCLRKFCLRKFFVVGLSLLLISGVAWAQATAALAGRVTDESGCRTSGVTVTVTQTDNGFTRTVATDGTGAWVMPNLPTGPYRLEVSLQGFRTYVQTGIVLQVGPRQPSMRRWRSAISRNGCRGSRCTPRGRAQRRHQ